MQAYWLKSSLRHDLSPARFWAAFSGAWNVDKYGTREAPPGDAARSRFAMAATWLLQLIGGADNHIFPLLRQVSHLPSVSATPNDVVLQVDASPWGAGATLKHRGVLRKYWKCTWSTAEVKHLKVITGTSEHQPFWESLAFLLCVITWSEWLEAYPTMLVGDSVGSLQNNLDLKGKCVLLAVSRELA